ncbi:tryptophan 2,3-dioxygenase family protein [Kutzneria sp. NPDC051319]|uniref:tryptophan 2,3-dioxygenase family protein n=1 Tax=Kutzneria sp. NPDC051319 TaxID=3155047 RepID=UPI003445B3D1
MTAYNDYLRAEELHSLQHPVSGTEGELSFLVVCQVQELYFALIGQEVKFAIGHLRGGDVGRANATLCRAGAHFVGLNASWQSLGWMKVGDFIPIKNGMTSIHGKSSSLQSWKFRELSYLLGLKSASLAEPVASMPEQHQGLLDALAGPCLYDGVLDVLRDHGFGIPQIHGPHASDPEIELAWGRVYAGEHQDLVALGDALLVIAEGYAEYRHLHLLATRRAFGNRPGYYGSSGADWLAASLHELPFPELWSVRTEESV